MGKKAKKIVKITLLVGGCVGLGFVIGNPKSQKFVSGLLKSGKEKLVAGIGKKDLEPETPIQKKPRYNNNGKNRNFNNNNK